MRGEEMSKTINFQYEIERLKAEALKLYYVMDIHAATFESGNRISMASDIAKAIAEQSKDLSIRYYEYLNGIRMMHGAMENESEVKK